MSSAKSSMCSTHPLVTTEGRRCLDRSQAPLCLLGVSLLLLCCGLALLLGFPHLLRLGLRSAMVIQPGTLGYQEWKQPSVPSKFKCVGGWKNIY